MKKNIREIQVKKDYAGTEASPYREWLGKKGDYNQEHEATEPIEANPDMLAEDQSIWQPRENISESEKFLFLQTYWKKLTSKQKTILTLVGLRGHTLESAAMLLGVSKGTVQKTIERLRQKIQMSYNKRKKDV